MALRNARGRLVADPSIGVSDLMKPLQQFMESQNSRDLQAILKIPPGTSWKTAVNIEWISHLSPLYRAYAAIASNTIIPPKKHKKALAELHSLGPVHSSKKADHDVFDYLDESIRIGFSHIRLLCQSPEARSRHYRKASPAQVEQIDGVIKLLKLADGDFVDEDSQPTDAVEEPSPPSGIKAVAASSSAASTSADSSLKPITSIAEASKLFKQVLAARDDEEEPITPSKPKLKRADRLSPGAFEDLMQAGDVDSAEEASLREAAEIVPIGLDGQAQLTIFKKNGGKSSKEKIKKAEGKTKSQKKPSTQQGKTSKHKPGAKITKAMKKKKTKKAEQVTKNEPAAEDKPVVAEAAVAEDEPAPKRLRSKQSLTPSDKPDDEHEPEAPVQTETRTKKRHRAVSMAYHTAMTENKHLGHDQAKVLARKAHKAAGEKFDAENPRV